MSKRADTLQVLRILAAEAAERAYVPYSEKPAAVALLLSDGQWIPGVRVENASFPLVIPAMLNAYTTAIALQRTDVCAIAGAIAPALQAAFWPEATLLADDAAAIGTDPLPEVKGRLSPFLKVAVDTVADGIALARQIAERAHVPASDFPVGCILETTDGDLIPGCNVEHAQWLFGLCAERNTLGTAVSYGIQHPHRLYLTCLKDPNATPCGACRQVLVEHSPNLRLWMDRGNHTPEDTYPPALLPGYFDGLSVVRSRRAD